MPFTIGGEWVPEKDPPSSKTGRSVKIIKEKRGSSVVTLILNLSLNEEELKKLCSTLKQRLGCGGSVKEGKVEIQGDKIQQVKDFLEKEGFLSKSKLK